MSRYLSPSQRLWTAGVRDQETDSGIVMRKSGGGCSKVISADPAREMLVQSIIAETNPAKACNEHGWIHESSSLTVYMDPEEYSFMQSWPGV